MQDTLLAAVDTVTNQDLWSEDRAAVRKTALALGSLPSIVAHIVRVYPSVFHEVYVEYHCFVARSWVTAKDFSLDSVEMLERAAPRRAFLQATGKTLSAPSDQEIAAALLRRAKQLAKHFNNSGVLLQDVADSYALDRQGSLTFRPHVGNWESVSENSVGRNACHE